MTQTVLVVAKTPGAGRSKTRLVPPLDHPQAADLHRALLLDTLEACRGEAPGTALLYSDPADEAELRRLTGPETRLVPQRGAGLADALRGGIADHVHLGPVAIVSSDIPGIPSGALTACFAALADGADVVLGPAWDGGYWLVAMSQYHEAPFEGIPWSTPAVLATTRLRCRDAGLQLHELEMWRDIDSAADLAAIARQSQRPGVGRRTRGVLRELDGAGAASDAPTLIASRVVMRSGALSVFADTLSGDGDGHERVYLASPRIVLVVAIDDDGRVLLVHRFRHPVRDTPLEIPSGVVNENETALHAAERVLGDHGASAVAWRPLGAFYPCPSLLDLRAEAFLTTGTTIDSSGAREANTATTPLAWEAALRKARSGSFHDGLTALAILLAQAKIDGSQATCDPGPSPRVSLPISNRKRTI